MKSTNHLKTIIITSLYICLLTSIAARDSLPTSTLTQNSIFNSFYNEDYIDITLESDFGKLIENKKTINYQDAWISYTTNEGKKIRQLIQIRPREESRSAICDIPSVMLNFGIDAPNGMKINGDQKLKLVTHCIEEQAGKGQQNVLNEYLACKLLNIITEKSFRVQLVRITYLNTINHDWSQRFGFIIEGPNELAERLEATSIKEDKISVPQLETDLEILNLFKAKKEEILSYCEEFNYLTKRNHRVIRTHVNLFFENFTRNKFVIGEFLKPRSKDSI